MGEVVITETAAEESAEAVEEVAEAVAETAEAVAEAVAETAEAVAEAVADAATEGGTAHDPIELEHRLTNIEHELQELRSRSYDAATHEEVEQVAEAVVETAAAVAEAVAEDAAGDTAEDDVTIVEPDVSESPRKRSWLERVW